MIDLLKYNSNTSVDYCSERAILTPCELEGINYQIDPYVGCDHYCYYCYALKFAETEWDKKILVHNDLINRLNDELEQVKPQKIYMGYHSDPYQACESTQLQTREVLELLLRKGFSVNILTKSDLVLRDVDLLKQMKDANVSFSLAFDPPHIMNLFEKNTVDTSLRFRAMELLKEAGIQTSAMICPVIPLINNPIDLIESIKDFANTIWVYGLSLNEENGESYSNILKILEDHFLEIKEDVVEILNNREHDYWKEKRVKLKQMANHYNLDIKINL